MKRQRKYDVLTPRQVLKAEPKQELPLRVRELINSGRVKYYESMEQFRNRNKKQSPNLSSGA